MSAHARLTSPEATILKDLAMRAGLTGRVTLKAWQRRLVLPLWRKELVEIWFRQTPDNEAFRRGPYYALTIAGFAVGSAIWAAQRKPPLSRPTRRRARHNQGATYHDHSRVRPEAGAGLSGRRVDHSDPGRDCDLNG